MKVIRRDTTKQVQNLKAGDIFRWLDNYYLVLNRYDSAKATQLCADIETGECTYIEYETLVDYYDAEVTLK